MRKVLILGGTGWLGAEVARQSLASGASVTCLARGESGEVPRGALLVVADRRYPDAYSAVSDQEWDDVLDVSWQPGAVDDAARALGERAAHWTYVSSVSVYREAAPGTAEPQDESAPTCDPWSVRSATVEQYGEAKAACERFVRNALGERALIVRPGLIGGPGDPSDRFGYWVACFARAGSGPVLVPAARTNATQTIDVRDLAAWIVAAAHIGRSGDYNLVGETTLLGEVLDLAADTAGYSGTVVEASDEELLADDVAPWAGQRSMPLWLPGADAAGFGRHSDRRAVGAGLERRPLSETMRDVLADEIGRGLHRARHAGLTRAEELALLSRMS
jgi:2'-hydroxyisoflavone reductase